MFDKDPCLIFQCSKLNQNSGLDHISVEKLPSWNNNCKRGNFVRNFYRLISSPIDWDSTNFEASFVPFVVEPSLLISLACRFKKNLGHGRYTHFLENCNQLVVETKFDGLVLMEQCKIRYRWMWTLELPLIVELKWPFPWDDCQEQALLSHLCNIYQFKINPCHTVLWKSFTLYEASLTYVQADKRRNICTKWGGLKVGVACYPGYIMFVIIFNLIFNIWYSSHWTFYASGDQVFHGYLT